MPAELRTCVEGHPLAVRVRSTVTMSDDQLFELCRLNPELRIERLAEGDLLIMPPTGGRTGNRHASIVAALVAWAIREGSGAAFDSSTGFVLPNGAMRAPDAAWVRRSRLAALPGDRRDRFLPLCPEFVIELRSPSDRLVDVEGKMDEYIAHGSELGWLVDPEERRVHVYRRGQAVERLDGPDSLSGETLLPGFRLDLVAVWEPGF